MKVENELAQKITVKIEVDTTEAIEKIECLKKQLQEMLELQNKL